MQETVITCDACGKKIPLEDILLINLENDLCEICTSLLIKKILKSAVIVLRKDCQECEGKGKLRVRDDDASCGENRTVYKTVECNRCFHGLVN